MNSSLDLVRLLLPRSLSPSGISRRDRRGTTPGRLRPSIFFYFCARDDFYVGDYLDVFKPFSFVNAFSFHLRKAGRTPMWEWLWLWKKLRGWAGSWWKPWWGLPSWSSTTWLQFHPTSAMWLYFSPFACWTISASGTLKESCINGF